MLGGKMNIQEKTIKKICNFYINEWHLVTAILPYVAKLLENGIKIDAYCEKNIHKNVELLLSRINIKNKYKKQILNINFGKENKNINLNNLLSENNKVSIIVSGSENYIEKVNDEIIRKIESGVCKICEINIINCYKISDNQDSIKGILEKYDKLLRTSGEIDIQDVF